MDTIFPVAFTKMSGTGNDFLIIDHRSGFIPLGKQPEFVKGVCRRMFSAGGDGVILIEDSDKADIRWRFYNSDGSIAEMCGNGARCTARFAFENGITGKKMRLETLAGIIEAEICEDNAVRIRMVDPFDFKDNIRLVLDGNEFNGSYINTGVPHVVLMTDNIEIPVTQWGRKIRFDTQFQPQGTNANFITMLPTGELQVRTYERGVEDETRACGTGAVASAIIAVKKKITNSPVEVVTSGGERLTIECDIMSDGSVTNVYLKGPARIIYRGELTAESML